MKEYFVVYRGTRVLMQFVRPSYKQGLLASAVDVLALMTLDSLSLPSWFTVGLMGERKTLEMRVNELINR